MQKLPVVYEGPTYVYIHTNKINNKKYVGITNNPKVRWKQGGSEYRGDTHFYRAIQKYGWNNFNHEIVCIFYNRFMAGELEKYLIKLYNTMNSKYGYNGTSGGESVCILAEHVKQRMSESSTKKKPIICLETKKIYKSIAAAQKEYGQGATISDCCNGHHQTAGGVHWMFLEQYKQTDPSTIKNIINAPLLNDLKKKKVICLETNKIYSSISEANSLLKCSRGNIKDVCLNINNRKTAGGYHWMFYEDYLKMSPQDIQKRLKKTYGRDRKQVVCLTTNTLYRSANQAAEHLDLFQSQIMKGCKTANIIKGYEFCFLEDYKEDPQKLIEYRTEYKKKRSSQKVICLNTNTVYTSIRKASKETGCNQMSIKHCCEHSLSQTKGLMWLYYGEYLQKENDNDK